MVLPDLLPILPFTRPVEGTAVVPGSKSLTNRALLLAALCREPVELGGALFSDDTRLMVEALRKLGRRVETNPESSTIRVLPDVQGQNAASTPTELFVGLAGTAARFLTAYCAAMKQGIFRIDGVDQMRKRPMEGLISALRALGCRIDCTGVEGFFPIEIHGAGLRGGAVKIDARESSQLLSGLLMVAPLAASDVNIELVGGVRWPFVQMTARLMEQFGQPPVERVGENRIRVKTGAAYQLASGRYAIEPDASAASYFLALPFAVKGSLAVPGLRPLGEGLQGDMAFADVLVRAGMQVKRGAAGLTTSCRISEQGRGVTQDFSAFSDTFLTLAALAPLLKGKTVITGIAHTRKQETDRVAGMARELIKLGQEVVEKEDSLEITPRPLRPNQVIETYGDHRFAMSFGILGSHDLHGDGKPWLTIKNPACCAKTFPQFFELLERLRTLSVKPGMETDPFIIVAIDGGAASGKSSTARAISERFHLLHVDTGSFYRAVTAELLKRGVAFDNLPAVILALPELKFSTRVAGRAAAMEICGHVAGEEIRSAEVNSAVSHFAAIPDLRNALLTYQRGQVDVARKNGFRGLVMEGRDIGTIIFPNADFRFFLHADPVERARRRAEQGQLDQVAERDRLDTQRKTAPLAFSQGAIDIDSTFLSLPQVVEKLSALIATKIPVKN